MFKGISHVAYAVRDMQAALRFYCEKLGMTHVFSIPDAEGNPWIEYLAVVPGQFLELFYAKEEASAGAGSYKHLCLETQDIQETAKALSAAGVTLRVAPMQGRDGNWQCWLDDPDGNPIECMQIDSASMQAKFSK